MKCNSCGYDNDVKDPDFAYPMFREFDLWSCGCTNRGCDNQVELYKEDIILTKWCEQNNHIKKLKDKRNNPSRLFLLVSKLYNQLDKFYYEYEEYCIKNEILHIDSIGNILIPRKQIRLLTMREYEGGPNISIGITKRINEELLSCSITNSDNLDSVSEFLVKDVTSFVLNLDKIGKHNENSICIN